MNTNLTKKINPSNWSEMDQKSKIQESWARRALALFATACSLAGTEVKGWLPGFFRSFWLVERRQPFPRLSQSGRGTSDQQREPFGAAKVRSRFFSAACALWPTIQPVRSVLLKKLIKSKKEYLLKLKEMGTNRNIETHISLLLTFYVKSQQQREVFCAMNYTVALYKD